MRRSGHVVSKCAIHRDHRGHVQKGLPEFGRERIGAGWSQSRPVPADLLKSGRTENLNIGVNVQEIVLNVDRTIVEVEGKRDRRSLSRFSLEAGFEAVGAIRGRLAKVDGRVRVDSHKASTWPQAACQSIAHPLQLVTVS